jgi:predicted signal transduction protein with EAL and GGDEF domain
MQVADRVVEVMRAPISVGGADYVVTVSVGIAYAGTWSADQLLHEADAAMYRAKDAGKNRVEVAPAGGGRPVVHPYRDESGAASGLLGAGPVGGR